MKFFERIPVERIHEKQASSGHFITSHIGTALIKH